MTELGWFAEFSILMGLGRDYKKSGRTARYLKAG